MRAPIRFHTQIKPLHVYGIYSTTASYNDKAQRNSLRQEGGFSYSQSLSKSLKVRFAKFKTLKLRGKGLTTAHSHRNDIVFKTIFLD